ncbi:hypothetical protein MHI32_09605 [Paenibacillus sp. FSL H7-0690]|jgi:hypothetical protein|uniref:hypothetical protein n=1 Tax=Paenibacillus sp. FSL H7-0690 TaxID=2921437 RepID=UPI0030EF126D
MVNETGKRLVPTKDVLRELYLKSGNQCAFPGCVRPMMNSDGEFVGQICHIEAAEPGGERFNPEQSNEERRSFENLLILCYDHHVATNNVERYPVTMLVQMKRDHESKFADIISKLQSSIGDLTLLQEYSYTTYSKKLVDHFGWGYSLEEALITSKEINEWVDRLRELPPDTRTVFNIMVRRSSPSTWGNRVILHEIEKVTADAKGVKEHYDLLSKYGFISDVDKDDELNTYVVYIHKFRSGWDFWLDLMEFCKSTGLALEEFIVQLNFSRLE